MIIALILYIIGFVCMGAICFCLACLGGKSPSGPEWAMFGFLTICWPLALPWFVWKFVRPIAKFKIWR